jgi:hypothetical protein
MVFLKILLAGMTILIVAIVMNVVAKGLGLATWYDFLNQIADIGLSPALRNFNFLDYLFLILIYPFTLGVAAFLTFYLTRNW